MKLMGDFELSVRKVLEFVRSYGWIFGMFNSGCSEIASKTPAKNMNKLDRISKMNQILTITMFD